MGQDNAKNEKSFLLALLLFVGAGVLLFMSVETPEKKANTSTSSLREQIKGPQWEKNVNRHLFTTNERMEFERQKMQIENTKSAPPMWEAKAQGTYKPSSGVDLSTDPRGYEIANELGRGDRANSAPQSPHEVVQGELFNEQQMEQYTKAYKAEYARQFIENAKRGGYAVVLSEDFRVLSVKPIRKPSGQGNIDPLYNTIDDNNQ